MDKVIKLIDRQIKEYEKLRDQYEYEMRTARALGFHLEEKKINNDISWCKEILSSLLEIRDELKIEIK